MRSTIVVATGLLIVLGAERASAQQAQRPEPERLPMKYQGFRPDSSIFGRLPFDSALRRGSGSSVVGMSDSRPECPMPVVVLDSSKRAKMAVVRPDTTKGYTLRVVPAPCRNPLGPNR